MTVEEDYLKSPKELFESLPENTQAWINEKVRTIWISFVIWCLFIVVSAISIYALFGHNPINEAAETWFQRSGSLVTLLATIGETVFLVKLSTLIRMKRPEKLSCEIYIERKYMPLQYFSLSLTIVFVTIGTIIWGYGDLLYEYIP
jgi:hypothetical protein